MKAPAIGFTLLLSFFSANTQQPEVIPQTGHNSQIFHLQYSEAGRHILSAGSDNTANVWDASTGMAIRTLSGHADISTSAVMSNDGKWVAIAGVDDSTESIQLWEVVSGNPGIFISHQVFEAKKSPEGILALAFSRDGSQIAAKSRELLRVYEIATGKILLTAETKGALFNAASNYSNCAVAFSDDGSEVISEFRPAKTQAPYIGIWNISSGEKTAEAQISGPKAGEQVKASLGKLGKSLITGNSGNTGSEETEKPDVLNWYILSRNGNTCAYLHGGLDNMILEMWDVRNNTKSYTMEFGNALGKMIDSYMKTTAKGDRSRWSIPAGFDHDGLRFAMGNGPEITIFSAAPLVKQQSLRYANTMLGIEDLLSGNKKLFDQSFEGYSSVAFSPDGTTIGGGGGKLTSTGVEGEKAAIQVITFWNLATENEIMRIQGQFNRMRSLAFDGSGTKLISAGNQIRVWDLSIGNSRRIREKVKREIESVAIARTGTALVASSRKSAFMFDFETGTETGMIELPVKAEYADLVLNSTGDQLIADGTIFSLPAGTEINQFQDGSKRGTYGAASFSEDGKLVAGGGQSYVLADAATGAPIKTAEVPLSFHVPGFRNGNDPVFVAASNGKMDLYDGQTTSKLLSFEMVPSAWQPGKLTDVVFSPNGSYVATGRSKNSHEVSVWNSATGKMIGTLKGHTREITGIEFSQNNEILATASRDAAIRLWKIPACKLAATLIPIDSTDFIITTPDNYYMATKGALGDVAFRVGDKAFPFEQFDLQFNRPDIVLNRIGLAPKELIDAYHKAYQKRLKRMKFSEDMFSNDFQLPEVSIKSDLAFTTTQRNYSFTVSAWDQKYNLDRLNVYVNDVPVFGMNGKNLKTQPAKTWTGPIGIELSGGINKIQVSTLNEKGVESLKSTFVVKYDGAVAKPDLYLITIGISQYKDTRFNLNYAAKDATDISGLFGSKPELYGQILRKQLNNTDATSVQIKALKEFLAASKIDDVVVIFIAGHGLLDIELNYYFGTHDINFDNPSIGGLPYEELESLLDGIKPRKKLLIMDTCHSGEVDADEVEVGGDAVKTEEGKVAFRSAGVGVRKTSFGLQNSFELMKHLFADLRKGTGATVISSAGGAEYAMEGSEWNNGVFTWSMLKGLKGMEADLNRDGSIMLSEIQEYVQEKVGEITDGKQVPTSRLENMSNDFRIW